MRRRTPTRLRRYDYSAAGAYFVTICAARRGDVFGHVAGGVVTLNALGQRVAECIAGVEHHHHATIDTSIVMPDHVHALVVLARAGRASVPAVVGQLKAAVSRTWGRAGLWQRGYYDHVVRDDADLDRVREYIVTNPARWSERHGR